MNKTVVSKFTFENKNGTKVEGQLFFPLINNIIYKPTKAIITNGRFDLLHNNNTGENAAKHRDFKNSIIKNHCVLKDGSLTAVTKEPFVLFDGESTGLVVLTSKLSGFNTNKEANITLEHPLFKRYRKAAKLFQNLKTSTSKYATEMITWDEAYKECTEYFEFLFTTYELNIKTASAVKMEVK